MIIGCIGQAHAAEGLDLQFETGPSVIKLSERTSDESNAFDLHERIDHLQQIRVGCLVKADEHQDVWMYPTIGIYGEVMFGHSPSFATSLYGLGAEISGVAKIGPYSSLDFGVGGTYAVMSAGYHYAGSDHHLLAGASKITVHMGVYPLDLDRVRIGIRAELYHYEVDSSYSAISDIRFRQYGILCGIDAVLGF